jgi:hypothetical protein
MVEEFINLTTLILSYGAFVLWIQRLHLYVSITYPFHIPALVESFQPDQNLKQGNAIRKQSQGL